MDAQQSWLDKATLDRFRFLQCVENRTWQQLASSYSPGNMISGGLGLLSSEAFAVWACFSYHPCLSFLPHEQGDMMCYVFNEENEHWHPWYLRSELPICMKEIDDVTVTVDTGSADSKFSKVVAWKNLVAHYKFDHNSNDIMLDSSGNGHHLTNFGASFDGDHFKKGNGSLALAGFHQYATFPPKLNLSEIWSSNHSGITFSFWARMSVSSAPWFRLFAFGDEPSLYMTATNYVAIIRSGNQNILTFFVSDASQTVTFDISPDFLDDNWHHIIWSISLEGIWSIYWDGRCLNPEDKTRRLVIPTGVQWTIQYIGTIGTPVSNTWLDGNLDDFRIYNRALNSSEAMNIYTAPDEY